MNKNTTILVVGILVIAILGFLIFRKDTPPTSSPSVTDGTVHEPETGFVDDLVPKTSEFGTTITLNVDQRATFSDGLSVRLKKIDDSRCKPDVQCIWQGQLSGTFEAIGGKLTKKEEIIMGTESPRTQVRNEYTFMVKGATEKTMTIMVTNSKSQTSAGGCYIGGCSSQICSDQKDIASTCEYKEEYMCYRTATCERQTNGQCGWTQTAALAQCLSNS